MADQGITADQTSYVTVGEMGMTLDDLKKAYQSSIQIANDAWGKSGYEQEGTDILDTVYSPTKPKPDPIPLPTSIPITPNPQEVEQAKKYLELMVKLHYLLVINNLKRLCLLNHSTQPLQDFHNQQLRYHQV